MIYDFVLRIGTFGLLVCQDMVIKVFDSGIDTKHRPNHQHQLIFVELSWNRTACHSSQFSYQIRWKYKTGIGGGHYIMQPMRTWGETWEGVPDTPPPLMSVWSMESQWQGARMRVCQLAQLPVTVIQTPTGSQLSWKQNDHSVSL